MGAPCEKPVHWGSKVPRTGGHLDQREGVIVQGCEGKTVLHIGCADYPFVVERHRNHELLHERIVAVAARTVGVDSSERGIGILRSLGYRDVFVGDAEHLGALKFPFRFDVVVAGELLEHLANPGLFLAGVREVIAEDGVLIVTVPNAFALKGMLRVGVVRSELVHAEHVSYFSAVTLQQLAGRYGFTATRVVYYLSAAHGVGRRLLGLPLHLLIRHLRPELGDGVVCFFQKSPCEKANPRCAGVVS